MLSGVIAGCVECVSVWPMENIKTQLQLHAGTANPPFKGVLGGLRYNYTTHGFRSLYRGLDSALVGAAPKAGIRFGGNAWCKEQLKGPDGKLTGTSQFLAGVGAGILEAIVAVTPMETMKTKLIESGLSFWPGLKLILKEEGIKGLYKGLFPTVLKQASNQGSRFWLFNQYKDFLLETWGQKSLQPVQSLLGGMAAGCFSVLVNNPVDVVKTKMQGRDASKYTSSLDCLQKILRSDGFAGLYRGAVARMGRVVPGQGVIFASYEEIQTLVEKHVFK